MTGGRIIKVCGMTDAENIRAVEALGVDMVGFIFYDPSPRCVRAVPSYLPVRARRVGVFVDASFGQIMERRREFGLDYVQLHGSESPELCRRLRSEGLGVIKAFGIGEGGAGLPEAGSPYEEWCSMYLFDTRSSGYGGSGRAFDWTALGSYEAHVPFLLSGGIGPEDFDAIKMIDTKYFVGVDLNSRFESSPGFKDVSLLQAFLSQLA